MGDRGHNRHGPKTGGCAPFRGELRPHLTQRRLGRGLAPYLVASWSIQQFGHNRHGPKIGWGAVPFFLRELGPIEHKVAWAEASLHTKLHLDPSNRLATVHQRYRETGRQDRQRSVIIGRTVLQTVTQKCNVKCSIYIITYFLHGRLLLHTGAARVPHTRTRDINHLRAQLIWRVA